MTRSTPGVAAVASVLAALGCSADGARVPAAAVADSAGVRIIAYDLTDEHLPPYRTVAEHDLQIGEMDGTAEYTFSRIDDLALASDGSILVSDGLSQELRLFDGAGRYVRTLGGAGEGPGEFASAPFIAGMAGDTVFAFDDQADRLTSFVLDGEMLQVITLRSEALGRPESVVRLADGSYFAKARWTAPSSEAEFYDPRLELDSVVVLKLDAGGHLLDTLRLMPDRNRARTVQDAGAGSIRLLQANTPHSTRAIVVTDGVTSIIAHNDTFSLDLLGSGGGEDAVVRVRGVDNPVTADEIRAHQEAALRERFGDGEIDPLVRRLNMDFLPERLPAFGGVVISDTGEVWVSLAELDMSEGLDWLVFSAAGELRGLVHTPPELRVREIREESIFGFVLDEFDVPYVRRYPLLPGADDVG